MELAVEPCASTEAPAAELILAAERPSQAAVVRPAAAVGQRLKNPRHERFAALCLEYTQGEAYRRALGKHLRTRKVSTVYEAASALAARPDVARRIVELRAVAAQTTALDLQERVTELRDIESADPSLLQYHPACRHCHGHKHAYQYVDESEWLAAAADAVTSNKPCPSNAGGYEFDGSAHPEPSCPQCFGAGAQQLYTVDVTKLPRAARRLFKGFGKNGELLLHDQMIARSQLSKILGLDREDGAAIARAAAAGAAAGAALGTAVADALTPEQRMAAYLRMVQG